MCFKTGPSITFQEEKFVDIGRNPRYTNKYTMADLFPDENPVDVLKRELMTLTKEEYIRTIKDERFKNRSEMREFGKIYNTASEVNIKIRIEMLDRNYGGNHSAFVMSFHYSSVPFSKLCFPYCKM